MLDAFRAKPHDASVHVALLQCYIAQRDWPRARQALENARSLAAEEEYPHLPLLRGLIHYYTGWFESALAHFELVLDSHPECAAAYLALAKAYIAQRQEAQACTALEAVLSIGPDPLGRSQPLPRREAMALQVLLKARSIEEFHAEWTSYPPSFYCDALIALHAGELQTAQALLRRSIEEREPLTLFAAADPLLRGLHPYIHYV
jgi:tetratricopeptide (TPR) repeat protein